MVDLILELFDTCREPLEGSSNSVENVPKTTVPPFLDRQESRRKGGILGYLANSCS